MKLNEHKETTNLLLFALSLYAIILIMSFIICKLYEKFI